MIPFNEFWIKHTAFLNGNIFIILIILLSNPSLGNHIPDNKEWALIITEETPPIDLSLHNEPKRIPNPKNNKDVNYDNKIDWIILILNIDGSNNPPITKNKIDWTNTRGINDNA